MPYEKGKLILKSEPPKSKFALIFSLVFGAGLLYLGLINLSYLFSASSPFSVIFGLVLGLTFICMSFALMGTGIMYFISYLKIYEDGIVMREATLFVFLKKTFLPHEQVVDVVLQEGHTRSKRNFLIIYFKEYEPFWLRTEFLRNSEEIKQKVLEYKRGAGERFTRLNFYKRCYHRHGGFSEILRPKEFLAKGTEDDPIVINRTVKVPRTCWMHNTERHIVFTGVTIPHLNLISCSNVRIENCRIKGIYIENGAQMELQGTTVRKKLSLKNIANSQFYQCNFNKLNLNKANNLDFKNTRIDSHFEYASKKNTFEDCKIEKLETNVKEDSFLGRNTLINTQIKEIIPKVKKKDPFIQQHAGLCTLLIVLIPIIISIVIGLLLR